MLARIFEAAGMATVGLSIVREQAVNTKAPRFLHVEFPLGLFVRNRTAAYVAYIAGHAFVFTFQTTNLLMEWTNGSTEAFGTFPNYDEAKLWGYGVVNLVIYGVGFGLVTLGRRVRVKRSTRQGSLELDPA